MEDPFVTYTGWVAVRARLMDVCRNFFYSSAKRHYPSAKRLG
jgi:hypothetical protein